MQEIIDGASATLAQAGIADTSGTLAAMQSDVDSAVAGTGTVDPAPSPTASAEPLDKVKAFVADVYTWGTIIEAETTAKADAFSLKVDLASAAANMSQQFLVGPAFDGALDAVMQNFDGSAADGNLNTYVVGLPGDPQFTAGTIANVAGVVTITNGVINGVTVNMSVQLPADATTASSFTLGIISATLTSAATDIVINNGSVTLTTASPYTIDYAAIDAGTAPEPDISGGSLNLDVSLTQKEDDLGAALVPTVTFAGTLSATLINPVEDATTGEITWITPSNLTITGNVSTSAGESLDASFTVNITNAATFTPVGGLSAGTSSPSMVAWEYTDVNPADGTDDTFTIVSPELTVTIQRDSTSGITRVTEMWNDGFGGSFGSNYPVGTFASIGDAVATAYTPLNWYFSFGLYPWVDGEGGYEVNLSGADYSVAGSADGTLVDPEYVVEDASQWLDATLGLNFALQLTGLPEASVNVSGDRTGFESGDVAITITYGTRQIVFDGAFTDLTSTGSMTITNQDGVTMNVVGFFDGGTADIKFNGTTYGTFEDLPSGQTKITYTDGTFAIY